MKQAAEEEEERAKRARIDAGKSHKKQLTDGELEQRSQQHQGPEARNPDEHCIIFTFLCNCLKGLCKNTNEQPNDKEIIEEESNGVTETLMRAVGTDWSELRRNSENQYRQSSPRPLQAILKKRKNEGDGG